MKFCKSHLCDPIQRKKGIVKLSSNYPFLG
ncbi:hypothetical protein KM92DES2_11068 [uncultured Desulfovibrio sp.]|uniref:Uncharacterized protein n=1 Tax=uncultured Desulfovibrio sp. TaxID=167968 RepID=A0A212JH04_9BACT|nr:hypothetical protein KM92DES2_11068 [uncultured Desulfovibrio sp.]